MRLAAVLVPGEIETQAPGTPKNALWSLPPAPDATAIFPIFHSTPLIARRVRGRGRKARAPRGGMLMGVATSVGEPESYRMAEEEHRVSERQSVAR